MDVAEPLVRAAWPTNRAGLHATARRLVESGGDDAEIMRELQEAWPGLLLPPNPFWRQDAVYQNVITSEQMAAQRRRRARSPAAPSVADNGAMSPGLVAFAEARGLACAYCGRAGGRDGDPDGRAWHRDSVPRGFQTAGRDLELCCSACKTDPQRHHRLGDDIDAF